MDVRTPRGLHVLVVSVDGGTWIRLVTEAAVRRLDWVRAWSPADADVLVVCGDVTGWADEVVERLWAQLPGPRVRVDLTSAEGVPARLAGAAAGLRDSSLQAAQAEEADRAAPSEDDAVGDDDMSDMDMGDDDMSDMDMGDDDMSDMDMGDDDTSGMDMSHHDTSGMDMSHHDTSGIDMSHHDTSGMDMSHHDTSGMDMSHHDMGGMDMSGPYGLALAQGADDDRDGLEMDVAHLVLGPGLLGWPAGLVLRAELHGDVVTGLETVHEATPVPYEEEPVVAALLLDSAANVLELTGWMAMSERLRATVATLVDGGDPVAQANHVDRLARRVDRSSVLRWSLEGTLRGRQTSTAGGVVRRRLLQLLHEAAAMLRDGEHEPDLSDGLPGLQELAIGQDVGTLRLLVSALALEARTVAYA